jgi:hypothetical protein
MTYQQLISINWSIANAFLDCLEEGREYSMI